MIRRWLTWFVVGAALGMSAAMWLGPNMIAWWSLPPGAAGSITGACNSPIRWALEKLIEVQLACGAGVGLGVMIVVALFRRRRSLKATAQPAAR